MININRYVPVCPICENDNYISFYACLHHDSPEPSWVVAYIYECDSPYHSDPERVIIRASDEKEIKISKKIKLKGLTRMAKAVGKN